MIQRVTISVPAYIDVLVELEDEEWENLSESEREEIIFEQTGKYPQIKHGENWDVSEYEVLDIEYV